MYLTFRWFGPDDPVPLAHIRQIPGVEGVVSALYDVAVGDAWPRDDIERLRDTVDRAGLRLSVVESIPVHEDIKLGRPTRDRLIEAWSTSLARVGAAGVPVVCYNFMPVFDWTRTDLARPNADGSTSLAYDDRALARIDLSRGTGDLPGWAAAYTPAQLAALLAAYQAVSSERLWENLAYFLERVVPVAESAGVRLAIHPDDPPWPIFGLPRIITSGAALARVTRLVDSPANGVTLCTGSLGADPSCDIPGAIRQLGARVHFAHCRNVRDTRDAPDAGTAGTGASGTDAPRTRAFQESPHPSPFGRVDMLAVVRALSDVGFTGPVRPDHGRMIWGETGRPGYGLFDRALGATYLYGLWEAVSRTQAVGVPLPRATAAHPSESISHAAF